MVFSSTTTWVFRAGPVVGVSAVLLAGSLAPFGAFDAPVRFTGDLVLFAYLMALGRFFTTAAALDTGSAFEGMGAAREVSFACLAEAALFMAFVVLVRFSGSLSLTPMFHAPMTAPLHGLPGAALFLVAVALFVVLLAENCADSRRRSQHAPRAHDDPRGHGPRSQRTAPRPDPLRRGGEAVPALGPAPAPGPALRRWALPCSTGCSSSRASARSPSGSAWWNRSWRGSGCATCRRCLIASAILCVIGFFLTLA